MNATWHSKHVMPKDASQEQRFAWHRAHEEACACRQIPAKLRAAMAAAAEKPAIDPRFAPVVAAFARDRAVTYGGKGFGSTGLKVRGKLFAMIASKGQFVVKLPRARVEELVRLHKGKPFDPGHGRLMKEWLALDGSHTMWVALAREGRSFVGRKA
jgi:hypothetical protein